jgi:hypothetical protein
MSDALDVIVAARRLVAALSGATTEAKIAEAAEAYIELEAVVIETSETDPPACPWRYKHG